ncbi:predicted protein [Histoplasma mississippiense (nom. inval.)]|uniref:predicted protein n=1 Tax=Ajellomyces capsulatus (strain NAm1 / WU24) TaxID=2059318 RepID=UPI000157B630|nr:predicted protein [Histoplasma mississippiense (nom. inval.)]EDN02449.1 predicted protein [Histoplasma mississippiense (nom. inval.)]
MVPHAFTLRRVENIINPIHNSEKNSNGLISTSDDKNVIKYQPRSHDGFEVHKTYDHLLPSERTQQSAHVLNKLKRGPSGFAFFQVVVRLVYYKTERSEVS